MLQQKPQLAVFLSNYGRLSTWASDTLYYLRYTSAATLSEAMKVTTAPGPPKAFGRMKVLVWCCAVV